MKQQAIASVALDVRQATVVVSVRDEQGSVVMRATVATEAKTMAGLGRGLGPRVHVDFEEGTQDATLVMLRIEALYETLTP